MRCAWRRESQAISTTLNVLRGRWAQPQARRGVVFRASLFMYKVYKNRVACVKVCDTAATAVEPSSQIHRLDIFVYLVMIFMVLKCLPLCFTQAFQVSDTRKSQTRTAVIVAQGCHTHTHTQRTLRHHAMMVASRKGSIAAAEGAAHQR